MRTSIRKALNRSGLVKQKLTLLVSGLIAVGIAATILLAPEAFYAGYGIEVAGDANLVNELKAPAGLLLAAGLLMVAGIVRTDLIELSLTTGTFVYLSYGLARLTSIAMDGLPAGSLVSAAAIELAIGAACLLALLGIRSNHTHPVFTRSPQ